MDIKELYAGYGQLMVQQEVLNSQINQYKVAINNALEEAKGVTDGTDEEDNKEG